MLIAGHPGDACHGVGRQKDMSMDMTRKRSLRQRLGWLLRYTCLAGTWLQLRRTACQRCHSLQTCQCERWRCALVMEGAVLFGEEGL
jgi:hypothetical protein